MERNPDLINWHSLLNPQSTSKVVEKKFHEPKDTKVVQNKKIHELRQKTHQQRHELNKMAKEKSKYQG
jgi:hypothetical protein